MAVKRGLGSKRGGLNALLSKTQQEMATATGTTSLPIDQLQSGQYQPRRQWDQQALDELTDSIRAQGLIQPIVVRQLAEQQYEIVAGERRWRACKQAGLDRVDVVVKRLDDQTTLAVALVENIQREDLSPIEEANALHRLQQEFELNHEELASAVGRSRSAVTNLLRLRNLDPYIQGLVQEQQLSAGHVRALLPLSAVQQVKAAQRILDEQLSVRKTEAWVKTFMQRHSATEAPETKSSVPVPKDVTAPVASSDMVAPHLRQLEQQLMDRLNTVVSLVVTDQNRGKGQLSIQFDSLDQLQGLLKQCQLQSDDW